MSNRNPRRSCTKISPPIIRGIASRICDPVTGVLTIQPSSRKNSKLLLSMLIQFQLKLSSFRTHTLASKQTQAGGRTCRILQQTKEWHLYWLWVSQIVPPTHSPSTKEIWSQSSTRYHCQILPLSKWRKASSGWKQLWVRVTSSRRIWSTAPCLHLRENIIRYILRLSKLRAPGSRSRFVGCSQSTHWTPIMLWNWTGYLSREATKMSSRTWKTKEDLGCWQTSLRRSRSLLASWHNRQKQKIQKTAKIQIRMKLTIKKLS